MDASNHRIQSIASAFLALHDLGIRNRTAYSDLLRHTLEAHPAMIGVWSVWEPDALDGDDRKFRHTAGHDATGRFVPHWHRANGSPKLDPVTGYEKPGLGDWYWVPRNVHQLCSMEPYWYPVGDRLHLITSEVAPIVHCGRCLGVVGIDHLSSTKTRRPARPYTAKPTIRVLDDSKTPTALTTLTPREREVHHWLSQGKSNEEIGIILGISAHTVKNHLERVFQKLGVDNRTAAALTA